MNLPFLKKQGSQEQEPEPPREQQAPQSGSMGERVEEALQQINKWRELAQTKEGRRQLAAEFYQMAAVLALLSMDEDELEQLLKEAGEPESKNDDQSSRPDAESQPELVIPRGEPQPPAAKSGRPRSLREIAGIP